MTDFNYNNNCYDSDSYLTNACLRTNNGTLEENYKNLMILREFRDDFIDDDDIIRYYDISSKVTDIINDSPNSDEVYNWIYSCVVMPCVSAVLNGEYEFAYGRFMNSISALEKQFLPSKGVEINSYVKKIGINSYKR